MLPGSRVCKHAELKVVRQSETVQRGSSPSRAAGGLHRRRRGLEASTPLNSCPRRQASKSLGWPGLCLDLTGWRHSSGGPPATTTTCRQAGIAGRSAPLYPANASCELRMKSWGIALPKDPADGRSHRPLTENALRQPRQTGAWVYDGAHQMHVAMIVQSSDSHKVRMASGTSQRAKRWGARHYARR